MSHDARVALQLCFDGDSVSGHVGVADSADQPFTGWLGLLSLLTGMRPGSGDADPEGSITELEASS